MNRNGILGQIGLGIAIACACISTGLVVQREFRRPTSESIAPVKIKNWSEVSSVGHRMGPADAAVTIVEFADFQCPACRHFEMAALGPIRRQYPRDVQVVFRNWPLPYHKMAIPAARAAECSASQGRFEAMYTALYRQQDSLGSKPFERFATEAGVLDLNAFRKCNESTLPLEALRLDTVAAREVGGRGTPTVIVNGTRLLGVPDSTILDKFVRDALKR